MKKNQNEFKVVFDGKVATLNSEVLITSLLSTTNILQEINKNLKGPKLEIYIKPFAPGSFDIFYTILHVSAISGLIGTMTTQNLKYLVDIIVNIFNLKKFLKGRKPAEIIQEGNKIKIKNNKGNILVVDNRSFNQYKNNGPVNDSLNKIFRTLEENENIDSMQITDKENRKLFQAERTNFKGMCERNELLLEDVREKIESHAKLVLYRIVFAEDRKWAFVYQDTIISAYIIDQDFFEHFDEYRFGSGDYIEADLKIIQKFDETIKAYINIDYEVVKIYKVKKREEQKKLKFNV